MRGVKNISAQPTPAIRFSGLAIQPIAGLVVLGVAIYLAWILSQSSTQFLQFSINGLAVGAVYALMALGFNMIYSTVWFFDLSYGAMAIIGAYTVFYFTGTEVQTIGRGQINNMSLNVFLAAVVAGVLGWFLYTWLYPKLRRRFKPTLLLALGAVLVVGTAVYMTFVLSNPDDMHRLFAPAVGLFVAVVAGALLYWGLLAALGSRQPSPAWLGLVVVAALALGIVFALLVAQN